MTHTTISAALAAAIAWGGSNMSTTINIPRSVQVEHATIHAALVDATHAAGAVGEAAKELARILHPHFVREEEIALPPLGLLARLADDRHIPDQELSAALAMTDALKRELRQMLDEHIKIRAAVERLRLAALVAHDETSERLATDLALHAQTEEEVLYPAAILVGELIRSRARTDK
jgi:hypothetical protein